jgi:hypothetical protein
VTETILAAELQDEGKMADAATFGSDARARMEILRKKECAGCSISADIFR